MVESIVAALTTEVTGVFTDVAPIVALIMGAVIGVRLLKRFAK